MPMKQSLKLAALDSQDQVNSKVYHSPKAVHYYRSDVLEKAEACALLKYQSAFAGRDVLDIGVGTGRTALYLSPLAHRYLGVDYSPHMVNKARSRWPTLSFELADMRELSNIPSGSFDMVMATNNVLDAVSHQDRIQALNEWRRVLRAKGMLLFSSHNRCYAGALRPPRLMRSRNPVTQGQHMVKLARQWRNYLRLKRLHRQEVHYAVLSDTGHDYACLHYYIDREAQAAQLQACGFAVLDVFDVNGACLAAGDFAEKSPWLFYVAQVD